MRTSRNRDPAQIVGTAVHAAKFCAPRSTATLVARQALIASLDQARSGKLALLLAPAGSGKSTLLSQWFAQTSARRIAWLLCDRRDRDPDHFFSCLAATAQLQTDHRIDALRDQLASRTRELTIVIDDLQFCDVDAQRALSDLILHSSPSVSWILASREHPRLDLGRFKLDDRLISLGAAELRFQPEEICELARLLQQRELSPAAAADYYRRTEGWVAGVKLLLINSSERTHSGLNHDIAAYLQAGIWEESSPALREFMLNSCLVERMCADLCDRLHRGGNAAVLLEELERMQRFLDPLDAEHRWFRYRAPFGAFLQEQLRKLAPERISSLHKAASRWFAEHDLPSEALSHAFAAGDRRWAVALIADCVPTWLRTGEFTEVLQWTSRLSLQEVLDDGVIRDAHLMSLIFSRQFDRAHADLTTAEKSNLSKSNALPALRLMLNIMTDAASPLTLRQIESCVRVENPYLSANLLNVSAYQMLVDRKYDVARRLALRGRDLLLKTDHVYTPAQSAVVLMLVDRAEGHAREAAESCMRLYARAREGQRNPIWVTAATAAASVHYHHNRLQQAEALCGEVLPLLGIAPSMENLTVGHVVAARLKCAVGRYGEALRLLDYLHSVLESSHCRRLLARVCFEKVRLWLLQDQPLRALTVLADCGQSLQPDGIDDAWEEFSLSRVAILIHRGSFDEAAGLLQTLCERSEAAGDVYGQIRVEAALATCHWNAREEEAGYRWLNHALQLSESHSFSRAVFDDVYELPKVFATALKLSRVATLPSPEYFKRFRDVLAYDPYEEAPAIASVSGVLTQRELDLLKLLSMGLSNRDISERCNITLLTTKWHLKNVFAKLGVGTRMEAVFRAQELQLVEGRAPKTKRGQTEV